LTRSNLRLPFDEPDASLESRLDARDREGRNRAVDPRFNVALEASAGTGKTRVLVDRYVNLLRAGVDPANILAITFTRKAAAEMRERIIASLTTAAARGEIAASRWRELRDRVGEIAISTIDAFCLSLLREFPLEADLDPGFSLADDTEVPRLIDESLDRALRICRAVARDDEQVALVFAQLGDRRARKGLAALLNRRIVAPAALMKYLGNTPRDLTVARAAAAGAAGLLGVFDAMPGGFDAFIESGPPHPAFLLLVRHLHALQAASGRETWSEPGERPGGREQERADTRQAGIDPALVQAAFARAREHFLTQDGKVRSRLPYTKADFTIDAHYQTHRELVLGFASGFLEAQQRYRRDLNVVVSRGVFRMYRIAEAEYRRTLESHAVLDFSDVLLRTLELLRRMEEFAQSRYRLESRYHHVLVDEFQDTSRAQWELVSLLVQAWGEGAGLAHSGPLQPSIFIVGDRKQSIYSFRDADVSVLQDAARHLEMLRPDGDVRRSISRSFRAVPSLLAFVNDVCADIEKASRPDAFRYDEQDRFPLDGVPPDRERSLGVLLADTPEDCAGRTANEIATLLAAETPVRDRETGMPRAIRAGDIAILFRTRDSHREYEAALEARGIASYVYKGLGFFDADEIKDVTALLWYLAEPQSNLRAAALLRSRFVALSDPGLRLLAPHIADALGSVESPADARLEPGDRVAFDVARAHTRRWRDLVDQLPPAELLDHVLVDARYAAHLAGPRFDQARENLKKIRALIRRIQNRGYATLGRIVAHLDRLAVGDEANAAIDALDAVNLMTVHAAKGLEFPVVFVVNLSRGTGNWRDPIRVAADPASGTPSVAVGDYQSEADDDDRSRDREETKRLLYVALTRARDRLYLGSVLRDGKIQPGRGSLAEVLPVSLLDAMNGAAAVPGEPVRWRSHTLPALTHGADERGPDKVRATSTGATSTGATSADATSTDATSTTCGADLVRSAGLRCPVSDFEPIDDAGVRRLSVAAAIADADALPAISRAGQESHRLLGTLVHRLVRRFGLDSDADADGAVLDLLHTGETVDIPEGATVCRRAANAFRALCSMADVRDLYHSGAALHEVPFTLRLDGRIVRGTIDCLVVTDDSIAVLEFKTGRARPEHAFQVELYGKAMQAAYPGRRVDLRVIYLGEAII
jgi:ATP-dependent helicase/nuclease subunit A